ncbi:HlyD family efflux transporter periplasmic adaptor subunit [Aeromonas sp. 30P]|uniref:HlyD family efflux transporter periplasmic adaptor subunit n=1 Tax=Aeromonas sp. 30P TaxID=3452717 RepID=UPI0038D35217
MFSLKGYLFVAFITASVILYMFFSTIELVSPGQGIISGGSANNIEIVTPSSGFVSHFNLKSGDRVKRNEILFSYVNIDVFHQEKSLVELLDFFVNKEKTLLSDISALNEINEHLRYGWQEDLDQKFYSDLGADYSAYRFAIEHRSLLEKEKNLEAKKVQIKNENAELSSQIANLNKLERLLIKSNSPAIEIIKNSSELSRVRAQLVSNEVSFLTLLNDGEAAKSDYSIRLLDKINELNEQVYALKKDIIEKAGTLDLLKNKIKANSVESPVDGVVLTIDKGFAAGSFIDVSKKIMTIKRDDSKRLIEAKFDAKYRPFIYIGGKAKIIIDSPGFKKNYTGIINKISADSFVDEANPSSPNRHYKVDIIPEDTSAFEVQNEGIQANVYALSREISIAEYLGAVLSYNMNFNVW